MPKCVRPPLPGASPNDKPLPSDPLSFDIESITAQLCFLADTLQQSLQPMATPPPSPILLSACPLTRSPSSSITQVLLFHWFGRVIWRMLWTPRLIGRLKRFIALWVVESFGTTSTSWRLVVMVNGSMVGSFLLPLALLPLFPNPNADWSLTVPDTTILMLCI